jgi:predicted permease
MAGVFAAGLAPALRGGRQNLGEVIKGAVSGRRGRAPGGRQLLVAGQVAMAFVLLFSAGLLLVSFARLMSADPGFVRDDLLSIRLELPAESYPDADARRGFLHRLRDELHAGLPDQLGAATVATGLVDGISAMFAPMAREGSAEASEDPSFLITWGVAPDYFHVVGVPVTEGRAFTETDGRDGENIVIVNDGVARRFFAGIDPVGRRLRIRDTWYRVVGVAGTVRLPRFARSAFGDLQLFFPLEQDAAADLTVLTRIRGDPSAALEHVRTAIQAVDPFTPILKISLAEDALAASVVQERSNALLTLLFAVTALLLGAVGIYGVVAYSVGRQIREIGIRIALGATRGGEVTRVVVGGMKAVALGLAVGIAGAVALGPALAGFLHEVGPRDPSVSAGAALVVAAVALLATWIPARKVAAAQASRMFRAE